MLIPYSEILKKYDFLPSGILHLGAHEAEEAEEYQKSGVDNVIWIEGNPELVPNLKEKLKKFSNNQILNLLVSDADNKDITLNVTNSTMSSSILDLAEHKVQHPEIDVVKSLNLKTTRLDSFISNHPEIDFSTLNFLNIDIQGAELLALRGLGEYIKGFEFIYTEINLANIYEGCPLLEDLDLYLGNQGFKRVEVEVTEWLWGDALYQRCEMTSDTVAQQVKEAKELTKRYNETNRHKIKTQNTLKPENRMMVLAKKIIKKIRN